MPVTRLADVPDLLALHAANPGRYPFLLETGGGDGWQILFAFPQSSLCLPSTALCKSARPFLSCLDEAWRSVGPGMPESEAGFPLPFTGGWFIYMGYELLHQLEPSVAIRDVPAGLPVACLIRVPAAVVARKGQSGCFLVAEPEYISCLEEMRADVANATSWRPEPPLADQLLEEAPEIFLEGVNKVKSYIREGDVFQVNLSRQWDATLRGAGRAADLYAHLRTKNPAPFGGLANFGAMQIVSSSPERLVRVRNGIIETRPIAGTHPRGESAGDDDAVRETLRAHPKERAEHIMLVDLERNDLGRLCRPGSVEVDELMAIRTYAHVHHIESNIRGRLRVGVTPGEVLRATFPGGTITGCPKVRTMQIIRELENAPRLAYTGSMGYLNRDGSMDLNILIRTFLVRGDQASFRAGAGIVADSEPGRELNETRAKAKGLLRALGVSV